MAARHPLAPRNGEPILSPNLRKRVRHYGKLPIETIRDWRLVHGALGCLLEIISLPDNWVVRADQLAAPRPQGRDAVASLLRNLARCGYYRVERRKLLNGQFQMGTAVSEESVPQWEAEYKEFDGKPIPLVEQPDGTFKVRRANGVLTDDGFVGRYDPAVLAAMQTGEAGAPTPPASPTFEDEIAGHAGNGFSVSGGLDLETAFNEHTFQMDISGHGISGPAMAGPGYRGPFSNVEKKDREVAGASAGPAGSSPAVDSGDNPPLPAVGGSPTVTRPRKAPSANQQDRFSRGAWQIAGLLPRRYREGLPPQLRFPMVAAIRSALVAEFGPGAILRYATMCATHPDYAADRHIPLLNHALRLLGADGANGLICRACGVEPGDPFAPPCSACAPADGAIPGLTAPPATTAAHDPDTFTAEVTAAWAHFGLNPDGTPMDGSADGPAAPAAIDGAGTDLGTSTESDPKPDGDGPGSTAPADPDAAASNPPVRPSESPQGDAHAQAGLSGPAPSYAAPGNDHRGASGTGAPGDTGGVRGSASGTQQGRSRNGRYRAAS